jgi:transposase InsO family protein
VAPNLLDRRFDGWQPDQAWVADITYVATGEGWLYLAAVMDLAGRRIVGCLWRFERACRDQEIEIDKLAWSRTKGGACSA